MNLLRRERGEVKRRSDLGAWPGGLVGWGFGRVWGSRCTADVTSLTRQSIPGLEPLCFSQCETLLGSESPCASSPAEGSDCEINNWVT